MPIAEEVTFAVVPELVAVAVPRDAAPQLESAYPGTVYEYSEEFDFLSAMCVDRK